MNFAKLNTVRFVKSASRCRAIWRSLARKVAAFNVQPSGSSRASKICNFGVQRFEVSFYHTSVMSHV